jgi:hypothetical protein
MAVNVPVEFWDKSTWDRYFREELGALHSALAGFMEARREVLGRLSGDLAQVLGGGDRDLALQILLGGVRQECVDKGVIEHGCFPEGSAARFFREKLGFEVSLDSLNKLINALKAGKMPQELGKITDQETDVVKTLMEVKKLLDEVYRRVSVEAVPKRYEVRDARDLVVAYEEVLNAGLRLLPHYNPFTFFLNSLRLTPKPFLRLMYGERLFDGDVAALMEKYGVKIGLRIAPGLGKELDEELGLYGHEKDAVGDLVARAIGKLYEIYGDDEFKTYLNKYAVYDVLESVGIYTKDLYSINVYVDSGIVRLSYDRVEKRLSYFEFVERFSPIMFLGLSRPGSYGARICLSYACLYDSS